MMTDQATLERCDDVYEAEEVVSEFTPAVLTPPIDAPCGRRCRWYAEAGKSAADYAGALVLLALLLPVIGLAALAVKIMSPGPAFFRQIRVGRGRREFRIWKIRTMVLDAEAGTGAVWSQDGDPRVTPLGRFLRASHIDEFPQLFNVLAGEMSLVGPRPERPEFVSQLEWRLSDYGGRLDVRPGITGLAQVLLPPDVDLSSVRLKLAHDLHYVRNLTPKLDAVILLHTAIQLGRALGSAAIRPFKLPCVDTSVVAIRD